MLWWQQKNVETQIAHGLFWLNGIDSGLQDPGWTNQNQKKWAGNSYGNSSAGNSKLVFVWFKMRTTYWKIQILFTLNPFITTKIEKFYFTYSNNFTSYKHE